MSEYALPPEVEAEIAVTAAELRSYINQAVERVADSPPEDTVAMLVAFMALVDLLVDEAHTTTLAEFLTIHFELFSSLTRD